MRLKEAESVEGMCTFDLDQVIAIVQTGEEWSTIYLTNGQKIGVKIAYDTLKLTLNQ